MSKLTPAPWVIMQAAPHAWAVGGCQIDDKDVAEFAALARNFADVCERRKWSMVYRWSTKGSGWMIKWMIKPTISPRVLVADSGPFTSLLAAWQAAVDLDRKLTQEGR